MYACTHEVMERLFGKGGEGRGGERMGEEGSGVEGGEEMGGEVCQDYK